MDCIGGFTHNAVATHAALAVTWRRAHEMPKSRYSGPSCLPVVSTVRLCPLKGLAESSFTKLEAKLRSPHPLGLLVWLRLGLVLPSFQNFWLSATRARNKDRWRDQNIPKIAKRNTLHHPQHPKRTLNPKPYIIPKTRPSVDGSALPVPRLPWPRATRIRAEEAVRGHPKIS